MDTIRNKKKREIKRYKTTKEQKKMVIKEFSTF